MRKLSEETKRKISKAHLGLKYPNRNQYHALRSIDNAYHKQVESGGVNQKIGSVCLTFIRDVGIKRGGATMTSKKDNCNKCPSAAQIERLAQLERIYGTALHAHTDTVIKEDKRLSKK